MGRFSRFIDAVATPVLSTASNVAGTVVGATTTPGVVLGATVLKGTGKLLGEDTAMGKDFSNAGDAAMDYAMGSALGTVETALDLNPFDESSEVRMTVERSVAIAQGDSEEQARLEAELMPGGWTNSLDYNISESMDNVFAAPELGLRLATYEATEEAGVSDEDQAAIDSILETYTDDVLTVMFGPGVLVAAIRIAAIAGGVSLSLLAAVSAAITAGVASMALINQFRSALGLGPWEKETIEEVVEEALEEEVEEEATVVAEPETEIVVEPETEVMVAELPPPVDESPYPGDHLTREDMFSQLEVNW